MYYVNPRIQSEYRKIETRKNSVFGHFSRSDDAVNNQREERQHIMISGRFFSIFKILKPLEI